MVENNKLTIFIAPVFSGAFFVAKQFTLGKNERLKSRKLIEQLFSEGKKFSVMPFKVSYLFSEKETACLQFGAGVGTRNFKKAVDRNRVKRVMRETWRLQKHPLQKLVMEHSKCLGVFINYTGKELPVYKPLAEQMNKVIKKLETIVISEK